MKLKKIAAACKATGTCILYDRIYESGAVDQWIGNGAAMWPVRGLPYMDPANLVTLFELTPDQTAKLTMSKLPAPDRIDLRDAVEQETRLEILPVRLRYLGSELVALRNGDGVIRFLDGRWLESVECKTGELSFWERRAEDGTVCVAVKSGLLIAALMVPVRDLEELALLLRSIGVDYEDPTSC